MQSKFTESFFCVASSSYFRSFNSEELITLISVNRVTKSQVQGSMGHKDWSISKRPISKRPHWSKANFYCISYVDLISVIFERLISREAGFSEHESNFKNQLFQGYKMAFALTTTNSITFMYIWEMAGDSTTAAWLCGMSNNDRDCCKHKVASGHFESWAKFISYESYESYESNEILQY